VIGQQSHPNRRRALAGQPDEDGEAYGPHSIGQRPFSAGENQRRPTVTEDQGCRDVPDRRSAGQERPVEDQLRGTTIKVRDSATFARSISAGRRRCRTRKLRWYLIRSPEQSDLSAPDLPAFPIWKPRQAGGHSWRAVPTDCLHMIFLPVMHWRMVALDADRRQALRRFADHGTLNLEDGMG